MKTFRRNWYAPFLALALALVLLGAPQLSTPASSQQPGNRILAHALDVEQGRAQLNPHQARLSSGVVYALLEATGALGQRAALAPATAGAVAPKPFTEGCQNLKFTEGSLVNIRVNQDCSLRRQAEEVIVVNPTNPRNLIAGQNDSRIGFNHCGYDFSFDGGLTWGDQIPPFYQFLLADGHTADACSDPTATFDADGNAYVGGILFDINSAASAFVVMKSNAGIGGAYYHTPLPGAFQRYSDTPVGVVASDNDPNIAHDKEFIVADAGRSSPKKNNVYGTWTRFANTGVGVGSNSPIYFSQSTDGGATWSPGIEISGANTALCTAISGESNPNACDQDQGSHPVVGPDGTVYVAFGNGNGNTATPGVNQHLVVICPPGGNCSSPAAWQGPYKITDDYGTQPIGPDPNTACAAGRQCLPPNGYRLDDFVEGSLSVDDAGHLFFAWADFRNGQANCNPNGSAATATPPCNNDVFYTFSNDGGKTWSAAVPVTPETPFGQTAQWMPWSAVTPDGQSLWIAFYDRHYGQCETSGCNDITLAQIKRPGKRQADVRYTRLTTSSMPNLVPANNPVEAGFLGDYMWVTVDRAGRPYVVWADTRGLGGTVEEDIYWTGGTLPHER